jgi:hypothetical protein
MFITMVGKTWKHVSYNGFFVLNKSFKIVGCQIEIERIFSLLITVITKYLLGFVIANINIMTCDNNMDKNGE